jgi:diguanylate cyclase (GGDEF)-like protein
MPTNQPAQGDPSNDGPEPRDVTDPSHWVEPADVHVLADDVARALARPRTTLRFNAQLESRFKVDLADLRVHRYRIWGVVALLMFNLFNLTDLMMVPDIAVEARWVRFGIVTPVLLFVALFLHRPPFRHWREAIVASTLLLAAASVIYLFSRSLHPNALQYHSGVTLILLFGAIVARQRFGYAVMTSTLAFAMYAFGVMGLYDMPMDVKLNSMMVTFGSIVIGLMANYQMEFDVRRSYLMDLQQRIEASSLRRSRDELDHLSRSDPLTGLDNRRSFDSRLQSEWSRAQRNHESIALLYVDIDHFKAYNDSYGHQAGDACLADVARAIRDSAQRGSDLCARYGGEEFVVLLPQTTQEHALAVAKRVRQAVEALGVPHQASPIAKVVTVSVGVASLVPTAHMPESWLLDRADKALYTAKDNGRNRVCAFQPPT